MTLDEELFALARESEPDAAAVLNRAGDVVLEMRKALQHVRYWHDHLSANDLRMVGTALAKAEGRADG